MFTLGTSKNFMFLKSKDMYGLNFYYIRDVSSIAFNFLWIAIYTAFIQPISPFLFHGMNTLYIVLQRHWIQPFISILTLIFRVKIWLQYIFFILDDFIFHILSDIFVQTSCWSDLAYTKAFQSPINFHTFMKFWIHWCYKYSYLYMKLLYTVSEHWPF